MSWVVKDKLTNILNFHQAFWYFNQGNYIAIYLIKKFRHIPFKIWNKTKMLLLQMINDLALEVIIAYVLYAS